MYLLKVETHKPGCQIRSELEKKVNKKLFLKKFLPFFKIQQTGEGALLARH